MDHDAKPVTRMPGPIGGGPLGPPLGPLGAGNGAAAIGPVRIAEVQQLRAARGVVGGSAAQAHGFQTPQLLSSCSAGSSAARRARFTR